MLLPYISSCPRSIHGLHPSPISTQPMTSSLHSTQPNTILFYLGPPPPLPCAPTLPLGIWPPPNSHRSDPPPPTPPHNLGPHHLDANLLHLMHQTTPSALVPIPWSPQLPPSPLQPSCLSPQLVHGLPQHALLLPQSLDLHPLHRLPLHRLQMRMRAMSQLAPCLRHPSFSICLPANALLLLLQLLAPAPHGVPPLLILAAVAP